MSQQQEIFNNLNAGIIEERYYSFKNNLSKNSSFIKKYGGMQPVVNMLKGKHVLVVGAGPSLEREISLIKKYQQRDSLRIISVDLALPILVAHGIMPHFVVSCETKPLEFPDICETAGIYLLAFSCMSHSNLRKWKGNISFYNWMIENEYYTPLWDKAGRNLGSVATGSIVTTQAVSIALACGIKTLFIAGNDLAFKDRFYCRGSIYSLNLLNSTTRFNSVETKEFASAWRNRRYSLTRGDESFYTNNQFLGAKYWLEDLFSKIKIPLYENSVPGCGKYIEKISFKDYCEKYFNGKKLRRKR